jgi:hypothetical protein
MKRIYQGLLLAVLLVILSSYALISKKKDSPIPEDFDPKKTVLLIQNYYFQYPPEARKSYLKRDSIKTIAYEAKEAQKIAESARKIMKENYPYKYEFADAEAINSDPKYGDKDLFRFVLINDVRLVEELNNGQQNYDPYHQDYTPWFILYDRKTDKQYGRLKNGSFFDVTFKKAIEAIVDFARKK